MGIMFLEGKIKASGYGKGACPWQGTGPLLTTEVKPYLCFGREPITKSRVYWYTLASCLRQYYVVILGMVQITMCKYSNLIKPDPFLCEHNLYSHPQTEFSGVETPAHY